MLKSLALVGGLAIATVTGVAAVDSQAAGPGAVRASIRARLADTPLGKMLMGRLGRAMVLRAELDVSGEQRAKIRSILQSHRQEIAAAVQPVVRQRRALRDALLAKSPDEQQIRAASEALGKSIGDAAVTMSGIAGELREVMTDEQIEKIKQFRSDNAGAVDAFFAKVAAE